MFLTPSARLPAPAASGGYYMSMACPTVVAEPLTITGSIGVVTAKFNLAELYERIGYTKTIISRWGGDGGWVSGSSGVQCCAAVVLRQDSCACCQVDAKPVGDLATCWFIPWAHSANSTSLPLHHLLTTLLL